VFNFQPEVECAREQRKLFRSLNRGTSMDMNAKTAAIVLGVVFVLVGILGFIPNPLLSPNGLFVVNTAHNLVHLVSGLALLAGAYTEIGASLMLKIVGVVYAVVAVLGLVMGGNTLLGMVAVNHADHWLHVALAVVILAAGFLLPDDRAAARAV
jgi:hypothetical protein